MFYRASGAVARRDTLIEEPLLHRIAGESPRLFKMDSGDFDSPAAQFQFSQACEEERIFREAIAILDVANGFESALGTISLGHGDRAVECDYRGRIDRE